MRSWFYTSVDRRITQGRGENPGNYEHFGLPGDDGIDFAATTGAPVHTPAPGEIYRLHLLSRDGKHNYGNHVRILYEDGYRTI